MAGVSRPAGIFTPKQGQYLAFIHLYMRLHRRPPAESDMQEYFRVSPPSVHQMVLTLERAGFIRRQPCTPRSIELLVDPKQPPELTLIAGSTGQNHRAEVLGVFDATARNGGGECARRLERSNNTSPPAKSLS
jgi:SOS-response transcriptional repressor LexA